MPRAHGEDDPNAFRHLTFLGEHAPSRTSEPTASRTRTAWQSSFIPATLDTESAAFFDTLCIRGGLRVDRYRNSILLRRKAACLRALRTVCPVDGARTVERDAHAAERALGTVMIGVTAFFRDPPVFRALRQLLPTLHSRRDRLNVFSVGCSDGSELYSVAMLLAEDDLLATSRLWGLDCRTAAISSARKGRYSLDNIDGVPSELRSRYFAPARGGVEKSKRPAAYVNIAEPLRVACRWQVGDAFAIPPTPTWPAKADVILCRNLAIYLTPEAGADLWSGLVSRLRPGGVLVVGKAERPSTAVAPLLIKTGPCIYTKNTRTS